MKDFEPTIPSNRSKTLEITRLSWLRARIICIAFLLTLFFSFPLSLAHAAPTSSSAPAAAKVKQTAPDVLNLDQLKAKRTSVEALQGQDDSVKKAAVGFLDRAIQSRTAADQIEQDTKALLDKVRSASDRIKKLQAGVKRPLPSPDPSTLSTGMDLTMVEQKAHQEELDLVLAKEALGKWEAELEEERNSPQQVRLETAKINQQALEIGETIKQAPPQGEHPLVTDAWRTFLLAEKRRCNALLKLQQDRLTHHETLLALLTAEKEAARRDVANREALVNSWQAQVMKLRQDLATRAREGAEAAKKGTPAALESIQKELDINVKLSQDLESLTKRQIALAANLESQRMRLQELEEEFALTRKRIETAVLTQALSFTLREQRKALPSLSQYRRDSLKRQRELAEVGEAEMDAEKQLKALVYIDPEINRILRSLGPLLQRDAASVKGKIETLLLDRRDLLEKLESG